MSGTITVGDKILASHDNVSGKLSMSENVDMSNMVFPVGHKIQHKIYPVAKYTMMEIVIHTLFVVDFL